MELKIEKLEKIVDGLPIHYYLGRKLEVNVKDENKTYFELDKETINIGLQTINTALKDIDEETIDAKTLNSYVRDLVYHEVSHALLSPKTLYVNSIMNVFEDERIETICKDYYYNVNFKEFCKLINKYDETKEPETAFELFYNVIRFRNGPKEFTDRVKDIINKYSILNFNSKHTYNYSNDVINLYNDILDYFDAHKEEDETTEKVNAASTEALNKENENVEENFSQTLENAKKELATSIDNTYCKTIENAFMNIIESKKKSDKRNGSAINAYSGQFDIRSVVRKDYKWFVQSNRLGNVKHFSKVKLNLFIDTSGSFYRNDDLVNAILHSLEKLEKQNTDFEFDVVTMAMKQTLLPKNERRIYSRGGNCLDASIFDLYKKVQDRHSSNINIVLFDGDALSDKWYNSTASYENFKAFDNSNTILITDYSNKKYIEKASISKCKIVITSEYLKSLENNIIKSLSKIA